MDKILVITNDFPPRSGGIETFAYELVKRFAPNQIVVLTSKTKDYENWDSKQKYPIYRMNKILLPTKQVRKKAEELIKKYDCNKIWFVSSVPLGLLAKKLRANTQKNLTIVATSHGHETWWVKLPITRKLVQKVARNVDVFTFISKHTRQSIAPHLPENTNFKLLSPGVDEKIFSPQNPQIELIKKFGLENREIILCVGRLVKRKGQDILIKAMPKILSQNPKASLLIVGSGPQEKHLRKLIATNQLESAVKLVSDYSYENPLADLYALCEVFCMPCHTIHFGLEEEGLGIVYLEASAMQKPIIAGSSGGAPETVLPGVTGFVVEPEVNSVATTLLTILNDKELAKNMGLAGRERVLQSWTWDNSFQNLRKYLNLL